MNNAPEKVKRKEKPLRGEAPPTPPRGEFLHMKEAFDKFSPVLYEVIRDIIPYCADPESFVVEVNKPGREVTVHHVPSGVSHKLRQKSGNWLDEDEYNYYT